MNFQGILNQIRSKKVVVVGDLILDKYIQGKADRISPEAPVPVVEVTHESVRFGGSANVAYNISSLGGIVEVIGVVGDDQNGETLMDMFNRSGIGTNGIFIDSGRPTSTKSRLMANRQQIVRIDRESKAPLAESAFSVLVESALSKMTDSDAIIFEDYDKGVVDSEFIHQVLKKRSFHPQPVVVDPKVENFWNYKGVTSITPNLKEASTAVKRPITDDESLISVGCEIVDRLELNSLLITRGEDGMTLFQPDAGQVSVNHISTQPREVFDVTGAGDTVVSVYTLALAAGADFITAAKLANYAGGIVVGEIGCVAVTSEQLMGIVEENSG
ncbi:D-glycero-beta-D-manno-heptose-7-phosphate kinase [Candidatus Poribacteria bacterium]|nr:D-glycero-beta-D-manno-heptose-7-phosphate kinase [Candidatus Poribacteria bacterium]